MEFIKEVNEHGIVSFHQIKFRVGDIICYHSNGRDKHDLVVDPTVYVEGADGSLVKTTVKTTRQRPIADDILPFCHNYDMLDNYVAPARTLAKKKENIIAYISKEVEAVRFKNKDSIVRRENLKGVAIDYDSIKEYADFILKYYENQDGVKYRRVYDYDGYFHYVHLDENYESAKLKAIDFMKYLLKAPLDENGILVESYITPYRDFDVKFWKKKPFLNEIEKYYFHSWTKFDFNEIYEICIENKEE